MQEPTFASLEFQHKKHQARRERFLEWVDTPSSRAGTGGADRAVLLLTGSQTETQPAGGGVAKTSSNAATN